MITLSIDHDRELTQSELGVFMTAISELADEHVGANSIIFSTSVTASIDSRKKRNGDLVNGEL